MEVKYSIDGRKNAFSTTYELTDEIKKEIDELFVRIEEFGNTCVDGSDFETKFATSPLNQEYITLFTKVATTCPMKGQSAPVTAQQPTQSTAELIAEEAASDLKYAVDSATQPIRHAARSAGESAIRSTEIGNAAYGVMNQIDNARQLGNMFGAIKRNRDAKKALKEEQDKQ